jgi:nitroreductase
MNTLDAIAQRRSIRRFKDTPIPDEVVVRILEAAAQAPSGKNRQPWHFFVARGEKKAELVRILRQGVADLKARGFDAGSGAGSAAIMEQAPVALVVFNTDEERTVVRERNYVDVLRNLINVQSIGAAIQNMSLAALELGIGSLWVGDAFYAYEQVCDWLGEDHQLITAFALGYTDEQPPARPRKPLDEVTTWL